MWASNGNRISRIRSGGPMMLTNIIGTRHCEIRFITGDVQQHEICPGDMLISAAGLELRNGPRGVFYQRTLKKVTVPVNVSSTRALW